MGADANTKKSESNKDSEKSNHRRKKKKLYKVERSSGETQLLTKKQIRELNASKKERHKRKKYLKLAAFVLGIFITAFGAQLILSDVVRKYGGSSNVLPDNVYEQLTEETSSPSTVSKDEPAGSKSSLVERENTDTESNVSIDEDPRHTRTTEADKKPKSISAKPSQKSQESINVLSAISPTELSIVQAPKETTSKSTIRFVFGANKSVEFSYMLEGYDKKYSEFLPIKSKSYSNLPDGLYTFHLRAKDKLGEITEPINRTFTIDATPPTLKITESPEGTTNERNVTFRFSANEEATFSTYLQGYDNKFSEYAENATRRYNNLPNGDYTFQIKAKDKYGNESLKPVSKSFTVDAEAPDVEITRGPDSTISEKSVTLEFAVSEEATFAYYLKGKDSGYSDFVSNNSVTYNELSDGTYTFFVKARDKSGNIDPVPAKLEFTIDTTSPKTSITRGPKGEIKHSTVSFSFDADEKALFSYYLEGYNDKYLDYTSESSKTYYNLPDGDYIFHVRSKDFAENIDEKGAYRTFKVKTKELLWTEDFEDKEVKIKAGDFKGRKIFWGLTKERVKSGKHSLWCAKSGNDDQSYRKDMNVWYQISIDLSRFDKAEIVFWYYLDTTNDITDRLYLASGFNSRKASQAGAKYIEKFKPIWYASVQKEKLRKWIKQSVSLESVCGQPAVIMVCFQSDDKFEDEGAYIDDIAIFGKY